MLSIFARVRIIILVSLFILPSVSFSKNFMESGVLPYELDIAAQRYGDALLEGVEAKDVKKVCENILSIMKIVLPFENKWTGKDRENMYEILKLLDGKMNSNVNNMTQMDYCTARVNFNTECPIYYIARQFCASAGDYTNCMNIRLSNRYIEKIDGECFNR